jgi:tyrocidine synthetase-3
MEKKDIYRADTYEYTDFQKQKAYWLDILGADLSVSAFPGDIGREKSDEADKTTQVLEIPYEVHTKLLSMARKSEYGIFLILLASVEYLLYRYTGTPDVVLAVPQFTKAVDAGSQGEIILIKDNIAETDTFKEFLLKVRDTVKSADDHSDFPFYSLCELLGDERGDGMLPLVRTAVLLETIHAVDKLDMVRTDIVFIFSINEGQLKLEVRYAADMYSCNMIGRLLGHFGNLLRIVTFNPDTVLKDIEFIPAEEKQMLLSLGQDEDADYPSDRTMHELFEEQVKRYPGNIAVVSGNISITYSEINRKANAIAHILRENGAKPNDIIGITATRSIDTIAGILGILKAGAAYLPVDPLWPAERVAYVLEDSGAGVLLYEKGTNNDWEAAADVNKRILSPIILPDQFMYTENPGAVNRPSDAAYVIYTSGTTGRPKGAVIEHRNAVRLFFNGRSKFDFSSGDVWTLFHSLCFDFSVWEMYGALLYGGTLIIIPSQVTRDPSEYRKLLIENKVTILNQTPTAFYGLSAEEQKHADRSLDLRYIIFGGEALKLPMLGNWHHKYPKTRLVNMYGITETTVHVTYKEVSDADMERGICNIGRPIPTLSAYIMDAGMRLMPSGAPGELCVGGLGVARGYLNRPELTAKRFVTNPYKPHERIYRSGDIARLLPNGDLEYLGRMDKQLKIRGHRVEPGEIEAAAMDHDAVREAAAIPVDDSGGNKYICLYYVADKDIGTELGKHMSGMLPSYMLPSRFIRLDSLPVTSNNKLDVRALPVPAADDSAPEGNNLPENDIQMRLLGIWKEILKNGSLGINSNFFDSGGDSIRAISLVSLINRELDTGIMIKDIYSYQTVRELSGHIVPNRVNEQGRLLEEGLSAIEEMRKFILQEELYFNATVHDVEDFYPLSPIQQGMIFFTRLLPEEPIYHDQFPYFLKLPAFEMDAFKKSLEFLAQRHPILRTSFHPDEFYKPIQVVHQSTEKMMPHVELSDLSGYGHDEQQNAVRQYMMEDIRDKFNFGNQPLWRVRVFALGNDDCCIVLSCHHAVLDGLSVAIFISELFQMYESLHAGTDSDMPGLKSSYKEYVAYGLGKQKSVKAIEYWKDTLRGYTRSKLPFNLSGRKINDAGGSRILRQELDSSLLRDLEDRAKALQCTLHELCLCAHVYMLAVTTGETDIVTGVVTHDRPAVEDGDRILGCFLNTLPLRLGLGGEITKSGLAGIVKEAFRAAKSNELFLADIAALTGDSGVSGSPIFSTLFNFMDFHVMRNIGDTGRIQRIDDAMDVEANEMTNTLLDIEISKTLDIFYMQIKYSPAFFHDTDIQRAAELYVAIMEYLASGEDSVMTAERLIPQKQLEEMLYDFNETQAWYDSGKGMHELFVEQAQNMPDNIALVSGSRELSYGALNKYANRLAFKLFADGIKPGDTVGLATQRSFDMIAGMLAVLKCGAAYVPVDPEYPLARRKYIAEYSGVRAVLSDESCEPFYENMIVIDQDELLSYPGENPAGSVCSGELAYIIYTSGSTGNPKGVRIRHDSAVNLITWVNGRFHVNCGDTLLFITSMCFDLSVYDIFGILASGGKIVIAEKEDVQNPEALKDLLRQHRVTFWDSVPSTMNYLVQYLEDCGEEYVQTDLRLVFMSGDWIHVALPGKLKKYFPNAEVISLGGATEGTVWSIYHPVAMEDSSRSSIPYGRPIANTSFYILDVNKRPLPAGVAGELYIGGIGVAAGYMNDPEKTAASFVRNPYVSKDEFMYKTGDIGRMLPEGEIEFMGRMDHQVKIRGYRVELGEVESKFLKHPGIRGAVVTDRTDNGTEKYLCAYIVWKNEKDPAIREYLAEVLPDYMIPAYFIDIESIPLTANGKVDRKALNAITIQTGHPDMIVRARNSTEAMMMRVWENVLDLQDRVGIFDDFFSLGGNSLKAVQVVGKMKTCGVTVKDILQYPTIAELAAIADKHLIYTEPGELLPLMKKNLEAEYFFNAAGETDTFAELLDCNSLMSYFHLKRYVEDYQKYLPVFLDDFNVSVVNNSEGILYNIWDNSFNMLGDVFSPNMMEGNGFESMPDIENVLDTGRLVVILTNTNRVPFSMNFISLDYKDPEYPGDVSRGGHTFIAAAYDDEMLYYIEMPTTLSSNFIPYSGNKSVGVIKKQDLTYAFNSDLVYATIDIDREMLAARVDIRRFFAKAVSSYHMQIYQKDNLMVYPGREAIVELRHAFEKEYIYTDKANLFHLGLDMKNFFRWKLWEIIKKREMWKIVLKAHTDICPIIVEYQIIERFQALIDKWKELRLLIMDSHARGEFLAGKKYVGYMDDLLKMEDGIIGRFKTIAENWDEHPAGWV